MLSHPDFASIHWIGSVRDRLAEATLCINLMWARFVADLPTEFARET